MAKRLHKTMLDYLVIAISPAIIILLINSLVLFLVGVFYRGGYEGRLDYVLTLFVIGAVLIARISIEEGRERAMLFAAPLGIAILLAICRFVEFKGVLAPFSFFINLGLIALIWWSADKLTWDCTLIDEQEEDSGEGLLETIGLDKPDHAAIQREITPVPESAKETEATTSRDHVPTSWWDRFVERRRRPHAPGVWVVYFSLAALPLFGLGQLFIPNSDTAARESAFQCLFVYTASGLGLLLSTSFLGLRRYLRQRRQEMPLEMVNLWLGIGVALIFGVMFAALLLPRPNAEYAVSDLPVFMGSPEQQSSPAGQGQEGVEEQQPDAQLDPRKDAPPDAPQSDKPGDTKSAKGSNDDAKSKTNQQQPAGEPRKAETRGEKDDAESSKDTRDSRGKSSASRGRQSNDKAKSKEEKPSDRNADKSGNSSRSSGASKAKPPDESQGQRTSGGRRSGSPSRTPSVPRMSFPHGMPSFGAALKWLLYLALAVLIGWAAWTNREGLLAAIRDFRQMLVDLWNWLVGRKVSEAEVAAEEAAKRPPLPRFADYKDPFATGAAGRYPPGELVRYTFEALEAWARDTGCPRFPDQTPHEFVRSLAAEATPFATDAAYLAELYCHVAYAHATPTPANVGRLAQLWQGMRAANTRQAAPAAG